MISDVRETIFWLRLLKAEIVARRARIEALPALRRAQKRELDAKLAEREAEIRRRRVFDELTELIRRYRDIPGIAKWDSVARTGNPKHRAARRLEAFVLKWRDEYPWVIKKALDELPDVAPAKPRVEVKDAARAMAAELSRINDELIRQNAGSMGQRKDTIEDKDKDDEKLEKELEALRVKGEAFQAKLAEREAAVAAKEAELAARPVEVVRAAIKAKNAEKKKVAREKAAPQPAPEPAPQPVVAPEVDTFWETLVDTRDGSHI